MEFFEVIKGRRSVRDFQKKAVSKETLEKIVDAARLSPTARNVQPWEFVISTNNEIIKKISELAPNGQFIIKAPACIAVFCQDTKYYLEDGCAATTNILNAASALGLGSCWIAGDKKPYCEQVSKLFNLPSGFKLVSLIALGYSNEKTANPEKRTLDSVIHWEKF